MFYVFLLFFFQKYQLWDRVLCNTSSKVHRKSEQQPATTDRLISVSVWFPAHFHLCMYLPAHFHLYMQLPVHFHFLTKSEYNQEIPQSQTANL